MTSCPKNCQRRSAFCHGTCQRYTPSAGLRRRGRSTQRKVRGSRGRSARGDMETRSKSRPRGDCMSREKHCEFCSGSKTLYQYTPETKIYIDTFGSAHVLTTECFHCPPYAKCSMKNIPSRSAFLINFCPNCGRPLNGDVKKYAGKKRGIK